jgi:hypothetical protein
MSLDSQIRNGLEAAADRVSSSVEHALGEVLRRSRRGQFRRRVAAGVAVVAVMIGAVVAVGVARTHDDGSSVSVRTDGRSGTPGSTTLRNDQAAVSVSIPSGSHELRLRVAAAPPELLAYGTADRAADGPIGTCDTTPRDGVLVGIYEYPTGAVTSVWGNGAVLPGPVGPRPRTLASATPTLTATSQCAALGTDADASTGHVAGMTAEFYLFTEQNRTLLAVVASASGVSADQVTLAKQSLDTLKVGVRPEPGTRSPPATSAPSPSEAEPRNEDMEHFEGTYRGNERYTMYTGRCDYLDHNLEATFDLANGPSWRFRANYCGTVTGDLWTGTGTFTFTVPEGATLTGNFTSSSRLPSQGEPYKLNITGGTKRFENATGSCALDNHLRQIEFGRQEQFGTFVCDITR